MEYKLEEVITRRAYNEIKEKVEKLSDNPIWSEWLVSYNKKNLFSHVKKLLEQGDVKTNNEIMAFLDPDFSRVCSHCGRIMDEGWVLGFHGYACSDECCMSLMDISKEEYDKYSIFLDDITEYLNDEGLGRKPEDLREHEIIRLQEWAVDNNDDYYYTTWS